MGSSFKKNDNFDDEELLYFNGNENIMKKSKISVVNDYFISENLKGNSKDIFNNYLTSANNFDYISNPDSLMIISKIFEIIDDENSSLDMNNGHFIINNNYFCDSQTNTCQESISINRENVYNLFFANNTCKYKREQLINEICLEEMYDHIKEKSKLFIIKRFLNESIGIFINEKNIIELNPNNSCFISFFIKLSSYQILAYFIKEYEDLSLLKDDMHNLNHNQNINLSVNEDTKEYCFMDNSMNYGINERNNTDKKKFNLYNPNNIYVQKAKELYDKMFSCIKQISFWMYNCILDYYALNKNKIQIDLSENIFIKLLDTNILKIMNDLFFIVSFEKISKYKFKIDILQSNVDNLIQKNNLIQIESLIKSFNLKYYQKNLNNSFLSFCLLKKELKKLDKIIINADNFLIIMILCVLKISNTDIYSEVLLLNQIISNETKISEEGYIINTIMTANEIILSDIDLNKHLKIEKS